MSEQRKMRKLEPSEVQHQIGADILLVRRSDGEERKLRLTQIKGGKIKGIGHNGKEPIYYQFELIPDMPEADIYKIIH